MSVATYLGIDSAVLGLLLSLSGPTSMPASCTPLRKRRRKKEILFFGKDRIEKENEVKKNDREKIEKVEEEKDRIEEKNKIRNDNRKKIGETGNTEILKAEPDRRRWC